MNAPDFIKINVSKRVFSIKNQTMKGLNFLLKINFRPTLIQCVSFILQDFERLLQPDKK